MAQELDQKIQEVYKRIQMERKIMDGSHQLLQATNNPAVRNRADTQLRDAQRSLSYFEDTLRELQAKKLQLQQQSQRPPRGTSMSTTTGQPPLSQDSSTAPSFGQRPGAGRDRALPAPPSDVGYSDGQNGGRDPQEGGVYSTDYVPKPKPYSNLDLLRADTPYTTAKISRMLHQLEFKLHVEKQYQRAIDNMVTLYKADGDKKSRQDAEAKQVESNRKIQLLQQAVKRYKNLHIYDDPAENEEDEFGVDGQRKEGLRKPLSGKLRITIKAARELDHVSLPVKRSSKAVPSETTVVVKIEGTPRAQTHPSRHPNDRWNEEFEISIDKANEVEIAVYDRQGNDYPIPIGLLWLRVSDISEALRRRRVGNETGQGWVTAATMPHDGSNTVTPSLSSDYNSPLPGNYGGQPAGSDATAYGPADGIDAWFAVEPVGAIALHLDFLKENVRKRPADVGLGRQGAVRKKKEEVHEMNGHKFVLKQFYQIILCAFCNEFLLNAAGYQCEDCRYTCHKRCYSKVVTKCISKSNAETEGDEEKINHRIPHRFETITNIGANWCCHCGYMLPLGRKNARKCSECDITCHATCAHLVPDFCGMSMETANALLASLRDIKSHQQRPRPSGPQAPRTPTTPTTATYSPQVRQDTIESQFERLTLAPERGTNDVYVRPPGAMPPYSADRPSAAQAPTYPTQPSPANQRQTLGRPSPPELQAQIPRPSPVQPSKYPSSAPADGLTPAPPYTAKPFTPQADPALAKPYPAGMISQPAGGMPPAGPSIALQPPPQRPDKRKRKVGLDDFNFLAVLGKGNFGKVMLAEEKRSNALYAIKVLKKEFIIDNDEIESTRSEKRVFLTAAKERHPFLLGLHSCFQTETRIYFVMEYVSGGDLMLHIQRKQFSLRQAKFYASEVLLALEYFHANGIIYRDLKLDNILLTLDGHVKVADYGLCKEEMWYGETTSTFCGTPEFMAPEILLEQRYGRAVDWWAFGVLTYEMLLGQSPFRGDDEDEIFDAILEDEPLYPITMPRDAVSILQKLLTRDPARRLGSGANDAEDIKKHPFFKDVSWDDVFQKRIPPPYYPTITSAHDTSNFDQEFTREQPTLTPVHGQLSSRDQQEFQGFSWVAPWADN
ncbi:hypothetical protein CALVIDRAFT_532947 [Calocera viscosa TUFC12733]|uniref:protein kinase C n=1 Tax=Calocera viscosa (strain TUFC12733) TaxID=1330018 RepID=A0A167RVR2_CALVF|nr:hypothetical protein CALVIDRAFT_532947 [Calocera viscosa TUFC12733]